MREKIWLFPSNMASPEKVKRCVASRSFTTGQPITRITNNTFQTKSNCSRSWGFVPNYARWHLNSNLTNPSTNPNYPIRKLSETEPPGQWKNCSFSTGVCLKCLKSLITTLDGVKSIVCVDEIHVNVSFIDILIAFVHVFISQNCKKSLTFLFTIGRYWVTNCDPHENPHEYSPG